MFDLEPFKHPDHIKRRAPNLGFEELCKQRPDERTLPYFSIAIEQWDADDGFNSLNGTDQGDFLRLLRLLWRANVLLPDFGKKIAHELGLTEDAWEKKRATFMSCGLLKISPDGCHLVMPGLRQQYLNTLQDTNSRRKK
jgi:hypothetical protein